MTKEDIESMKNVRFLLLLHLIIPTLLYYLKITSPDKKPKFPATISFCIRKGIPKYV